MNVTEQIDTLFHALQEGDAQLVQSLLETNPVLVNLENNDGFTPLGYAAHFGHKEVVKLLLDYGAEINALSHSKLSFIPSNTALHAAIAGNRSVEVVELLIHSGADVNALDSHGHNPLQAAAFEGNLEIANLLIENGAEVSNNSGFGSALAIALKRGHLEFAEFLRKHGATE